jgi:hypothetical protein
MSNVVKERWVLFEGVGYFAGDCFCVMVNALKKEVGIVLKELGCFDGRGRVCLFVILMRVDNTVCACEMVIFFTAFL